MFSNNSKVASFYPTNKRPIANFHNHSLTNPVSAHTNNISFINNQAINYQDKSISDSVELALITINLSYVNFKSMNREELDNYVKNVAYNNNYESKKFLLALNILNAEIDKTHNNIIQQTPVNNSNNNKSHFDSQENKINMNEVMCVEPDEFDLDTNMTNFDNSTCYSHESHPQTISFINNANNKNMINSGQQFIIKQNKNLNMSTYSGNPMGTFKITNNQPVNSLRPINQSHKNDFEIVNQQDNISNISNMTASIHLSKPDINLNFASLHDDTSRQNIISQHNHNSQYKHNSQYGQTPNVNNIIQQTSTLSNPLMFQGNGGRKRTSNMDVGNSNNYLIIK